MSNLYLVRHAHAEENSPQGDFFRNLTPSGISDAQQAAKFLSLCVPKKVLFLSSSAHRAKQTALEFAHIFSIPESQIKFDKKLYTTLSADEFLELILGYWKKKIPLIVFGHNPTLSILAKHLIPDLPFKMCKSGILGFQLAPQKKSQAQKENSIEFIYYPKKYKSK